MADAALDALLTDWTVDPNGAKNAFLAFRDHLRKPAISFSVKARPGISYSLRAKHAKQTGRELFVLIDVIDDDPDNRWLSVCFYADMVTDPDSLADYVPMGLMGEDACCFSLDSPDASLTQYIMERLDEALLNAGRA
ncbi:MAG: hypothetical protein IJU76_15905 [Desulfovibrionaceae bacterium]|nr:hypothetical protein [Desulfovibrionaceae bacterium]